MKFSLKSHYAFYYVGNTVVDTVRGVVYFENALDRKTYYRCYTCGNESCSACGQMFQRKPLHVFWGEDICHECDGS